MRDAQVARRMDWCAVMCGCGCGGDAERVLQGRQKRRRKEIDFEVLE
jgi:hypothetical protein